MSVLFSGTRTWVCEIAEDCLEVKYAKCLENIPLKSLSIHLKLINSWPWRFGAKITRFLAHGWKL